MVGNNIKKAELKFKLESHKYYRDYIKVVAEKYPDMTVKELLLILEAAIEKTDKELKDLA